MNASVSFPFYESIIGQKRAMEMLANMLSHQTLHHALFFSGPPAVGKTTTALNLVKALNCETQNQASPAPGTPAPPQFCNVCSTCQAINFYKAPFLLNISLDDRIPYIKALQTTLKRTSSDASASEKLSEQLVGECYKLIQRHRDNILLPLKRKKVSYPKGIVFNQKVFDKNLHELYNALELFHTQQDISALLTPATLEILEYVQNSLDRTYFPKEGIEQAFSWTTQTLTRETPSSVGSPAKILILKGIEKINYAVIGKFLKILEDPIPNTRFILIAENVTDLHTSVIAPLLSRCFKIPFLPLSHEATQSILSQKLGISEAPVENLENFFRHSKFQAVKSSNSQNSNLQSKLALSIVQARKNSLSYIQYLAREQPESVKTLLNDLKSGLACYLETYFIKIPTKETAFHSKTNSLSHSLALAIKQIPLSLKKSLAFRALIGQCERLNALGVISNENLVSRLALFIRKIY